MLEGKSGWEIANNCINSLYNNGGKILSSAFTKSATTSAAYVATDFIKHKVVPLSVNSYLRSAGGKILPYALVAWSWGQTIHSIFRDDPIARANERGYNLV